MKRRQDNDVIDHTGVSFIEYDTKLSRSIGQYAGYDEDETKNRFDLSYNYVLLQKQNWTIIIDLIGYSLWRRQQMTMTWQII